MMRNGLYSIEGKALDGVEGGDSGVLVLRDGLFAIQNLRGVLRTHAHQQIFCKVGVHQSKSYRSRINYQ